MGKGFISTNRPLSESGIHSWPQLEESVLHLLEECETHQVDCAIQRADDYAITHTILNVSVRLSKCGFNWSLQHPTSNQKGEDVANEEIPKKTSPHGNSESDDVGPLATGRFPACHRPSAGYHTQLSSPASSGDRRHSTVAAKAV